MKVFEKKSIFDNEYKYGIFYEIGNIIPENEKKTHFFIKIKI